MDDQLQDPQVFAAAQAGAAAQARPSRRRFFELVAGAFALALFGRTASAAVAAAAQPLAELPPAGPVEQWCPGPDWERVPPGEPGKIGGWRNKKTGDCMTDWIPRAARESIKLPASTQGPYRDLEDLLAAWRKQGLRIRLLPVGDAAARSRQTNSNVWRHA